MTDDPSNQAGHDDKENNGGELSSSPVTNMDEAQARFDENMEAMKAHWPGLLGDIEKHQPMAELVFLDNGEPDLLFKGAHLYDGHGVYSYNEDNLAQFWNRQTRLISNTPDPNTLDKHAADAFMKTIEGAEGKVVFEGRGGRREARTSYFLFLLGIGLGAHLEEMIKTSQARVVLLVENNFEFFYQSLYVCDWGKIFEYAQDDGIKIEFIRTGAIRDIAQAMGGMFRKYNPTAVDGTLVYQHYQSSTYSKAYKYFTEKIFKLSLMGLGFFEDEIHMIAQSYENLSSGNRRIMRRVGAQGSNPLPAVIVGNGPSLDQHFEHLRRIQDKVVIISCGTAIDALLRNDILPDFQIQLERDVEELRLYRYTARNHDLSNICLVASTTVFPGIAELFGETIFFFRPGLSSMPVFMVNDEERLSNPDPSVTNAGLAFGLHAGFKEFYFFGTDVGAKSNDYHHSKSSLYHVEDLELPWYLDPKHNASITESFDTETQGNFGGTVVSSGILLWTKNNLETVIKQSGGGINFYNCSDGALIDGTLPLLASRLKIPDPARPKSEIMADFINRFPVYDDETFQGAWEKADIFNRIRQMADDMIAIIDENPELENHKYSTELMEILTPSQNVDGVAMMYRGTLFLYMISTHHFLNRAQNEEMMVIYREVCRDSLKSLILQLRDESIAYFEDAVAKRIDYDIPLDRDGKNAIKDGAET